MPASLLQGMGLGRLLLAGVKQADVPAALRKLHEVSNSNDNAFRVQSGTSYSSRSRDAVCANQHTGTPQVLQQNGDVATLHWLVPTCPSVYGTLHQCHL